MNSEKTLKDIFEQDTRIPQVVRKKADAAYEVIRTVSEEFDMEQHKEKRRSLSRGRVAVAALLVIFALGTTTVAAGNYFGLLDYFNWRNQEIPKDAEKLINEEVSQNKPTEEEKKGNGYVDFSIRQTLCDSRQLVAEIAAKPIEKDKYFLIGLDILPEDPVSALGIDSENGDMSVEEYAGKKGLKLLNVYANVDMGEAQISSSFDLKYEPDGTMIFVQTTENVIHEKNMTLTCNTGVLPPDGEEEAADITAEEKELIKEGKMEEPEDNWIRDSFTFQVTDNSNSENFVYKPVQIGRIEKTAIILDEVKMVQTEFGLYVDTRYHYDPDATQEELAASRDIVFDVVKENGDWLERGAGEAGGGTIQLDDGSFLQSSYYALTELSEEMPVKVFDCMNKNQYGIIKVKRQQ